MTSGINHAVGANVAIVAGMACAAYAVGHDMVSVPAAAILVSGLVLGKYANPDVRDQEGVRNHAEHLIYKNLGCIPGLIWTAMWYPLAWLIPHRHWASHLPGPATVIAWLWLFTVPLLVWLMVAPNTIDIALVVALLMWPGWALQDVIHLSQDGWRVRW